MINLHSNGKYTLVYNVNDWHELRTKHRIVGELLGSTGTTPALPLALCPEEAILLVKKGIARLVTCEYEPNDKDVLAYNGELNKLYQEEKIVLKDERKDQINNVIDKIILGKIKKGFKDVSADKILNEELSKLPELKKENMLTVISTEHPQYLKGSENEIPILTLAEHTTPTRCAVYEDLWEKRFYVTTARKFGGDFLVYLGDPVAFHAVYILKCVENPMHDYNITEVVMVGRLGNSVKKRFVLASLTPCGTVKYISLNWVDC